MAWNGTGTYVRIHNWVADAAVPIGIEASRMDAEDDSIAAGINNCIAKDGQNSPTQNLPMNAKKHTGVANGTALTEYAAAGQVTKNALQFGGASAVGTDAYAVSLSIAPGASYTGLDGIKVLFEADVQNTGACTMNLNTLGAKAIKLLDGSDPATGQILAGGYYELVYDETSDHFKLLNPSSAATTDKTARAFGTTTSTATHITTPWVLIQTVNVANRIRITWNAAGGAALSVGYRSDNTAAVWTVGVVASGLPLDITGVGPSDVIEAMIYDQTNSWHMELTASLLSGVDVTFNARWNE